MVVADVFAGAMAARQLAGSDRMARRTAAVADFGHGGDFSPAPTPGPALFGRAPELAARSLEPDTCGIVTMSSNGRTALTMIAATAESAFFGSGGTVTQTDPVPTDSSPAETGSSSGGGSSNNTGAIVGGFVGGVAVVAIAACVIVWMLVRRRRGAKKETPPASTPGQDSYMTGQPYVPSLTPQQHYAGNEEQYKYQSVPPGVSPPPVIHEAPADSHPPPQTFRAELEDRPSDRV
ncbi:hypothetical protein CkaCkLH20_06882 [Colletotrichum karsti]|uniref:Carcinoembryonic antigen-related cell adhesion molecule 1 n=1 Tax=Colletotrichum karsti TaxID=1095194 RepID=A0A9P6I5L8_9PEZI|nr:uncharacterized protein CkaCkLH20_06882 [Colletotrichum karsti]KAF9875501.1 hypothetical protein CkaCkLH20_06882 [Colletotrichum karsti]